MPILAFFYKGTCQRRLYLFHLLQAFIARQKGRACNKARKSIILKTAIHHGSINPCIKDNDYQKEYCLPSAYSLTHTILNETAD
jgi:hypothetical protein